MDLGWGSVPKSTVSPRGGGSDLKVTKTDECSLDEVIGWKFLDERVFGCRHHPI